jgi:hypothetical protein
MIEDWKTDVYELGSCIVLRHAGCRKREIIREPGSGGSPVQTKGPQAERFPDGVRCWLCGVVPPPEILDVITLCNLHIPINDRNWEDWQKRLYLNG